MVSQTVTRVKHIWETWDIRILMLTSLALQMFLTCLAPHRKRSANIVFKSCMWLLYLAANAVAAYTIGLISSGISDAPKADSNGHQNADLLALWAPFLLLHLGGPDTITALALEDNELWHRQALALMAQVGVTVYVIGRSFHNNNLLLPTVLMWLDGLIKYTERVCALYFASSDSFRDSLRGDPEPGPNYVRLMEEYSSAANANIPTEIQDGPSSTNGVTKFLRSSPNAYASIERWVNWERAATFSPAESTATNNTDVFCNKKRVILAYYFFNSFKGLLADSILSLRDRDVSRAFFLKEKITPEVAFNIIEIELNLVYDVFYTKAFLLQNKIRYARPLCLFSALTSLLIFSLRDNSKYQDVDVGITFTLLGGALALDIVSVIMFIFSDWWIIIFLSSKDYSEFGTSRCIWLRKLITKFSSRSLFKCYKPRRWSESISQYNLLKRCLNDHPLLLKRVLIKKIKELLIGWIYVSYDQDIDQLREFITKELRDKASKLVTTDHPEATGRVCAARGNLVLQDEYMFVSEFLRPWTVDLDYDESVLIWHLATDICYFTQNTNTTTSSDSDAREISKKFSDYMSYLMLRRQALVSSVVGMSDIRFEDTLAEVNKFLDEKDNKKQKLDERLEEFCKKIIEVKTDVRPIIAKGDKSKSVLFDACRLAKQLSMLGQKQWDITSKVWLELLSYAALRCSPRSHVAQLRRGGELVTIVWLLMAHLGIGEHFRQNQGYGWTKLIIYK